MLLTTMLHCTAFTVLLLILQTVLACFWSFRKLILFNYLTFSLLLMQIKKLCTLSGLCTTRSMECVQAGKVTGWVSIATRVLFCSVLNLCPGQTTTPCYQSGYQMHAEAASSFAAVWFVMGACRRGYICCGIPPKPAVQLTARLLAVCALHRLCRKLGHKWQQAQLAQPSGATVLNAVQMQTESWFPPRKDCSSLGGLQPA